jgi:DNA-binding transcriptional MerR regulator
LDRENWENSDFRFAAGTGGTDSLFPDTVDAPNSGDRRSPEEISGDRYTIGEVVSALREEFPSLSVSKIRYLERRRLLDLERTSGGYRLFSRHDIELLRYILSLQEKEYLPLEIIKQRIDSGIIQMEHDKEEGARGSGVGDLAGEVRAYTRGELCEELDADPRFIQELISVGVIGRGGNGARGLDSRDVEIARMAIEMSKYSIQPRHLRGIVAAVDREVAMFKQVLNPELRSGDEKRVSDALESARYLASVDARLKELIMASSIDSFGSPG